MLAISTAWNYRPGGDMRKMLEELKATGLNAVELGYKITVPELNAIFPLLKDLALSVSSVHNFCPVPDDHASPRHPSNHYRLSAVDEGERKLAVQWTKESVNTAVKAGASVVVIHAGTVEMPEELSEKMFKLYKQSDHGAGAFGPLREKFVKERRQARGPFLDAVKQSLKDVLPYAAGNNIRIGLETRYYPTEIPNDEEIGELLSEFHREGLWYWHDVGHAEANDRLGIYNHLQCLEKYADKLIGFHLHGVRVLRDHQAPLEGDFDIKSVYPFMKKNHIKVIESHGTASLEQVKKAAAEFLKLEP